MTTNDNFDWSDDVVNYLRQLWAEGHSTAEIGRRIGVSKNSVVGKVHRLDLPSRPSPIAKGGVLLKQPAKSTTVPRLADIVPVDVTTPTSTPTRTPVPVCATAPGTSPVPPEPAVAYVPPQTTEISCSFDRCAGGSCCWPIGEPGTSTFRFCGISVGSRTSYCPEHARKAYVRRAEASQNAASNT